MRTVRDPRSQEAIDQGIALWFPGPGSATGEDLAELHLHGGRAVVAAMLELFATHPRCREARHGEFARRAFENGRIDFAQAEGLADLIEAETDLQRRAALNLSEGGLGKLVDRWRSRLLTVSAMVEAELDFADEGDVPPETEIRPILEALAEELADWLSKPPAERLKDGVRVVVAGPPNAGKSSLINVLAGRAVALVADEAGTTRDRIETPTAIEGVPLLLIDTAGLRRSESAVEAMGVALSHEAIADADLVLWLGDEGQAPDGSVLVLSKSDVRNGNGLAVSAKTGAGLEELRRAILSYARSLLPAPGGLALNARHRQAIGLFKRELDLALFEQDILLVAENLRHARKALECIAGGSTTEDMLNALFRRLCIGK